MKKAALLTVFLPFVTNYCSAAVDIASPQSAEPSFGTLILSVLTAFLGTVMLGVVLIGLIALVLVMAVHRRVVSIPDLATFYYGQTRNKLLMFVYCSFITAGAVMGMAAAGVYALPVENLLQYYLLPACTGALAGWLTARTGLRALFGVLGEMNITNE